MKPSGTAVLAWALLLTPLVLGRASAAEDELPNLVPVPPYEVRIGQHDNFLIDPTLPPVLRFTTSTANRGSYPLELIGVPESATSARGYQCMSWDSVVCRERREVDVVVLHLEHLHWHYQAFATYTLRRLTGGLPDMTDAGFVAGGQKVSFCLMDTYREGQTPPGTEPLATAGIYQTCSGIIQGISPGWRDEYPWYLASQQIEIAGVPDGQYALVLHANPEATLLETTIDDNLAFTVVEISDNGTKAVAR